MRAISQLSALCVLLAPLAAIAQEPSRFQLFGGYSLAHATISTDVPFANPSHVYANGFDLSAAGYFNRWFGAVADFSGHFSNRTVTYNDPFSNQSVTNNINTHVFPLLFGPQVRFPGNRVTPFARVMFGLFRRSLTGPNFNALDNDFGFSVGGGVDVSASQHLGVRLGQVDYIRSHIADSWQNNWRFSAGLVFMY